MNNSDIARDLASEAAVAGVSDGALDYMVYDAAGEEDLPGINATDDPDDQEVRIVDMEGRASRINNEGFSGQIEFLLSQGIPEAQIREALGLPSPT